MRLARRILPYLILLLSHGALAWTPTHKVVTGQGELYLRPLQEKAVLFAFRPAGSAPLTEVDDSPLWDPDFIGAHTGNQAIAELAIGEPLEMGGGGRLFPFLDPVTARLTLEVRYADGAGGTRHVALEMATAEEPFTQVMHIKAPKVDHLYGLGEQFPIAYLGDTRTDWRGRIRHSGAAPDSFLRDPIGVYGNSLTPLAGGNVANALFPVLYMADSEGSDLVLFLDNPADSQWDFRATPWAVRLRHGGLGGALAWGEESDALRARYMEWTGRPPVPPRKAFGLWVSEYGYENWDELEEKAATLQEKGFPVDGFVLDLQWFGGIITGSPDSSMGKLTFDLENFPNPAQKIAELARRGLGIITIEESYIASNLEEFRDLAGRRYLVRSPGEEYRPHIIDRVPWWGIGSMLDYTNPEAAAYWHQTKREPLVEMGVMGHWTDLGEPEIFRHTVKGRGGKEEYLTPLYHGDKEQLEVNNLFGFSWARSIYRGYGGDSHQAGPRPLILARTGTSGIQRFGASLWSGDIGANWESLRSHYVAQGHMAFSGIDYYGSDVGGFFRAAFEGDREAFDELYSRWLAAACLTDVPLRPHTMNLGNKYETAPDRVGHVPSNLANLRLRYSLIPYLYSAAYSAWLEGEPVIAPLALAPGQSGERAVSGTVKWVGRDLLAQLVLEPGVEEISVPLPDGVWYDFLSGELVAEGEATVVTSPTVDAQGRLTTPLFARGGALIPIGSTETSEPDPAKLVVAVFPGPGESTGRIYHDDGRTEEYRAGEYAVTEIRQSGWRGRQYGEVAVAPVRGGYASRLPAGREVVLKVASPRSRVQATVDGRPVEAVRSGNFWKVTLPAVPIDRGVTVKFQ